MGLGQSTPNEKENIQIHKLMKKFPITRLRETFGTPTPQCVVGRIVPSTNIFQAPISGKPCVYYRVVVQRLQVSGRLFSWKDEIIETRSSDFKLEDNACPNKIIEVNWASSESANIRSFSLVKEKIESNNIDTPNHVKAFLERNHIDFEDANCMGRPRENYKFIEFRYDIGQKIAILAVISKVKESDLLFEALPITKSSISESYFNDNKWTNQQLEAWIELTAIPSIIISDDPKLIKNVEIGVLQPDIYKEFFDPKDSFSSIQRKSFNEESKSDYNSNFNGAFGISPSQSVDKTKEKETIEIVDPDQSKSAVTKPYQYEEEALQQVPP